MNLREFLYSLSKFEMASSYPEIRIWSPLRNYLCCPIVVVCDLQQPGEASNGTAADDGRKILNIPYADEIMAAADNIGMGEKNFQLRKLLLKALGHNHVF